MHTQSSFSMTRNAWQALVSKLPGLSPREKREKKPAKQKAIFAFRVEGRDRHATAYTKGEARAIFKIEHGPIPKGVLIRRVGVAAAP